MAEYGWRDIRQGDTSPADDAVAERQSWLGGEFRVNGTAGSSIIGWRCAAGGHPGTWEEIHGGIGGPITLRAAYLAGSTTAHQTLPLSDVDGGGLIIDGSGVGFTGALSLRVNSAAAGPFVVDRANGYVGIGQATPTAPLHISVANATPDSILLDLAGHQRITKGSTYGLSIVVPNTGVAAGTNWFDIVMGSTSKIKVEPGSLGGSNGVITFNNTTTWNGTFAHWSTGQTFVTGTPFSGSTVPLFVVTAGALTNQNASVDLPDVTFDLSHTVEQTGGVNHATMQAFQILAPTYTATSSMTVDDTATLYISGAPTPSTNYTATRRMALWIGAGGGSGNGGGIRTDGFGASGLIKNNNGGLWTLGVAGTDFMAPWSLTNESVVVSGGGATLTEDNANFYYRTSNHRLHVLGQTIVGSTIGNFLAGSPTRPTITSFAEDFDATETTGAYRDTGFFFPSDGIVAVTTNGLPSTVFESAGLMTVGLQARYLFGGTETGRTDTSPLVIYGGASTELLGLQFRTTSIFSATSGTQRAAYFNYLGAAGGFAPTSGSAVFRAVEIGYEVNQTGGASGTMTGLRVEATRTAVVGTHNFATFGTTARTTFTIADTNTSAYAYLGEQSTGFVESLLFFHTNVRQAYLHLDNSSAMFTVNSTGLTATALTGTGSQLVQASATGVLSRSAVTMPASGVVPSSTVALTGPAVVWTDASGLLNVDTARFVYDATNFKVLHPNGSATHPGLAPIGDPNTGIYSYGADVLAVGVGGRFVSRWEGDATSRWFIVGENSTGITAQTWVTWQTNARAGSVYMDNATGNILISTVGWQYPNGSAAQPSIAFTNSADTGSYRYGAGIHGIAGGGRHVARFYSDATSRYVHIGETSGVTALAYLEFDTASRAAALYVNDALSTNWLISTERMLFPNGAVASPSIALVNSTNTGAYRYAAGSFGVAADGRHTGRFESDSLSRYFYIGENSTGITGYAWLGFQTNVRAGAIYMDNGAGNNLIASIPFLEQSNGSFASPAWSFLNDTTIGMYRDASGVLGLAGNILVGDGSASTSAVFSLVRNGANDRVDMILGDGGYTIADGVAWNLLNFDFNTLIVSGAAVPTGGILNGAVFTQPTFHSSGVGGNAKVHPDSSTVTISGPPVLTGTWNSAGIENALFVASGRVRIHDDLIVDGVMNVRRNSGTPQFAIFAGTGGGAQVSGGTLAGVIAGLVTLGFFSS